MLYEIAAMRLAHRRIGLRTGCAQVAWGEGKKVFNLLVASSGHGELLNCGNRIVVEQRLLTFEDRAFDNRPGEIR
jgi:hypothetical protein